MWAGDSHDGSVFSSSFTALWRAAWGEQGGRKAMITSCQILSYLWWVSTMEGGTVFSHTPEDIQVLILATWWICYVAEGTLQVWLKLRWGDYPGLSGWTQSNHKRVLKHARAKQMRRSEWHNVRSTWPAFAGFEDGGRGHESVDVELEKVRKWNLGFTEGNMTPSF